MTFGLLQFVIDCGYAFVKGVQAVILFNHKLVSGLFTAIRDGWNVLASVSTNAITATGEVGSYVFELCGELFNFADAVWRLVSKLYTLLIHVGVMLWLCLETLACYIGSCILYIMRLLYFCIMEGSSMIGLSSENIRVIFFTAGRYLKEIGQFIVNYISEICYATRTYAGTVTKYASHGFCMCTASLTAFSTAVSERILNFHDRFISHIPRDYLFGILIGIIVLMIIKSVLVSLHRRGFHFPSFRSSTVSSNWTITTNPSMDDDFIVSDDELLSQDEGEDSDTDRENDESESSVESNEVEEYEVNTSSDDEFSDNDDENNPNIINVHLPERSERNDLTRHSLHLEGYQKDSPDDLKRILEHEQERKLCVVCRDMAKSVLVLPCRHMCMCIECAHQIVSLPNRQRRICPLCRSTIHTVMNVFL